MITAYLVGVPAYHESDGIEIRYCIYDDQELIQKKSVYKDYKKPLTVNLNALTTLLKELEPFRDQDIVIMMNDSALKEQIKGTTTTTNKEVLKASEFARASLRRFGDSVVIKDVSKDRSELLKWDEILKP